MLDNIELKKTNKMFEELFKYNKKSGIYMITNIINDKKYIGQSRNLWKRIREGHVGKLRTNVHYNIHLQNAWNKYGEENFKFEIIEECLNNNELKPREQYWMDYYKSYNKDVGYNIRGKADNSHGYSDSEELRKLKSERMKGKNNHMFNKTHTDEAKRIIALNTMKKVYQLDMDGNLLNIFESSVEASEKLGLCAENIRASRQEVNATYSGYIWLGEEQYNSPDKNEIIQRRVIKNNGRRKSVYQMDLNNNIINEYRGVREAQRLTNIFNIASVVIGRLKTAGGFKWIYVEDYKNINKINNKDGD